MLQEKGVHKFSIANYLIRGYIRIVGMIRPASLGLSRLILHMADR